MKCIFKNAAMFSALILSTAMTRSVFAAGEGTSRTFPTVREVRTSDEAKPSLGLNVGYASTENSRTTLGWGLEAGFQPIVPFTSAILLGGYTYQGSASAPTLTRTMLMYKAAYNFGGSIPVIKDSYAGVQFGPVFDNINNNYDIEFGAAPVIGFDIPLSGEMSHYSLGANANYLFVGGSKNDVFALNGVAKYWF
ncbi:MAG: hypothetical protein ACXVA9_11615 [Bdellovibrionales bacterium]